MCLLLCGTRVTLKLVITAQRLCVAKVSQAARDRRVLLDVDAQVEKVLVFARHRLAVQALGLARQNPLEDVADPRVLAARATRRSRGLLARLLAALAGAATWLRGALS